jgi:phosphoribosyl 1,2-cyclic phosphodiesterase
MEITTLASSSTGNAYIIRDDGNTLLLECGISLDRIRRGCNYRLSSFDGCLLSHAHLDHAKAARDVMASGVDLYCSAGTAEFLQLAGHRLHIVKAKQRFKVGPWGVVPFDTQHDAAEPLGSLIMLPGEKLLFATDTYYLRHTFPGLTQIMLECNYDINTLDANVDSGEVDIARKSRLLRAHMSLEQCKKTLIANDLSKVREIHLLHLSFQNADAERFKREIQRLTGKRVIVAGRES